MVQLLCGSHGRDIWGHHATVGVQQITVRKQPSVGLSSLAWLNLYLPTMPCGLSNRDHGSEITPATHEDMPAPLWMLVWSHSRGTCIQLRAMGPQAVVIHSRDMGTFGPQGPRGARCPEAHIDKAHCGHASDESVATLAAHIADNRRHNRERSCVLTVEGAYI